MQSVCVFLPRHQDRHHHEGNNKHRLHKTHLEQSRPQKQGVLAAHTPHVHQLAQNKPQAVQDKLQAVQSKPQAVDSKATGSTQQPLV